MVLRQCNHGYCHSCVQKLKKNPDPGCSTVLDKVFRCIGFFCKTTVSERIVDNYLKLMQSKEKMVNIDPCISKLHTQINLFFIINHAL